MINFKPSKTRAYTAPGIGHGREVLNILQAEECGCAIITVPHDILGKAAKMFGLDLTELSLDTVKTFAKDAADAGYKL